MTIDERLEKVGAILDRLAERQQALAESVEILAGMQKKTEKEIRSLTRLVRVIIVDHEAQLLRLEGEEEGNSNDT